jgi:Ca2+-binding RTX toxin-like protein
MSENRNDLLVCADGNDVLTGVPGQDAFLCGLGNDKTTELKTIERSSNTEIAALEKESINEDHNPAFLKE